jgi:hypothetical protein
MASGAPGGLRPRVALTTCCRGRGDSGGLQYGSQAVGRRWFLPRR